MEKEIAKKILETSKKSTHEFNLLLREIKETCTEEEFKFFQKSIARVLGYMFFDIISPVYEEFPEYKPTELN